MHLKTPAHSAPAGAPLHTWLSAALVVLSCGILTVSPAMRGTLGGALTAAAADPAEARVVRCAECGMSAKVSGRYTARLLAGGATRYFCDIGELASFLGRTAHREYTAFVRDFPTGEWLDARAAFYAVEKRIFLTPMGSGVAAFRDRAAVPGAPLDFEALRKAQR